MKVIPVILLFILCFSVNAQDKNLPKGAIQVTPENIKWIDAPPPLPAGSKIAVFEGNPKQEGIFTMRVMLPPYYKVPAHLHAIDERVTVLEGAVYVGFGDVVDTTNASKFVQGSFYVNPQESHHYIFTQSEGCEFQVTGFGPWAITYIEDKK